MDSEPTEMAGVAEAETQHAHAWALDCDDEDEFPTFPARRLTPRRITALSVATSLVLVAVAGAVAFWTFRDANEPVASAPAVVETVVAPPPVTVTVAPPPPVVVPSATPEAVPRTPYNDGLCNPTTPQDIQTVIAKSLLYPDHFKPGEERYVMYVNSVAGVNGYYEYVTADIWEGRQSDAHQVAPDQVWVIRNGTPYSITDAARQWSTLPDGSGLDIDRDQMGYALDCLRSFRGPPSF